MSDYLDGTTDGLIRHLEAALAQIAAGRLDNGRALSSGTSQEIARDCLFAVGTSWMDGVASRTPSQAAKSPSDGTEG